MLSSPGEATIRHRGLFRFAVALLVPAMLILWLLYSAQTEEEAAHGRNLRRLAQMAAQISDRVQVRSDLVHHRSERLAASTLSPSRGSGAVTTDVSRYSVDDLVPLKSRDNPDACGPNKDLTFTDAGREPQLLFVHKNVCAESDLKALVEPVIRKDAFTSLILVERTGRVLYQYGPPSLRLTNVKFLFAGGDKASAKASPTAAAAAAGDIPTSSIHLRARIGDAAFDVFAQPLKGNYWALIGISEKYNLLRSSAPNDLLLIIPLVVLFVGLSWPLQRLWSMAPFEALRRSRIVVIGICSLALVVVLSLLCVYEYSRNSSMTRADRQLRSFADALGRNFKTELKLAVEQLYDLDEVASRKKMMNFETHILAGGLEPAHVRLPFEYADWIDGKGCKVVRWTTRDVRPQSVKVDDRNYFKDALSARDRVGADDRTPSRLIRLDMSDHGFAIEQVLSRTSGQAMTMLAIPSTVHGIKGIEVASLAVNFVSLSEPVTPRDLGFAIIDASGGVLFHSDSSRIFAENLLEESQNSAVLRSAVSRRLSAFMNLEYDASPHRMFVTPIPGVERLPWTLVVFRKLAANRIARMQIFFDASALLVVYWIGLAAALALGRLSARRSSWLRRPSLGWWWTTLDPGRLYAAGAGFVLVILLWRAFDRFHDSDLLCVALASSLVFLLITAPARLCPRPLRRLLRAAGVPAILMALAFCLGDHLLAVIAPVAVVLWGLLVSRLFYTLPCDRRRSVLHAAWLVWGVELALVLCIAPVLHLSRLAYEYEVGLHLRDSQYRLWSAEGERRAAVTRSIDQIPGVGARTDIRNKLLSAVGILESGPARRPLYYYGTDTSRISLLAGTAPANDAQGATDAPADAGPRIAIAAALTERLLAAMELPGQERRMGVDARRGALQPAGNLWRWEQHQRYLCLRSEAGILAGAEIPAFFPFRRPLDVVHASSNPEQPLELRDPPVSSASAWVALLVILGAVALLMNALRRRLLLLEVPPPEIGADPPYECGVSPPQRLFLLAEPGSQHPVLPLNLSSYLRIDLATENEPPAKGTVTLPPQGLLLDHFEARFQDPKVRNERLEWIEAALLAEGGSIAIRSTIDCVTFLSGASAGADENEIERWGAVMNYFERRTLPRRTEDPLNYAAIWDTCSELEKHVLMHMYRHGLVNPCASETVVGLLRHGLIRRTHGLVFRFFRPEFRRFVGQATVRVQEKMPARTGGPRLPVYVVVLLLLGLALLVSQEELTTRLIGLLTTLTSGFDAVRRQLAGLKEIGCTMKS